MPNARITGALITACATQDSLVMEKLAKVRTKWKAINMIHITNDIDVQNFKHILYQFKNNFILLLFRLRVLNMIKCSRS